MIQCQPAGVGAGEQIGQGKPDDKNRGDLDDGLLNSRRPKSAKAE